MLMKVRFMLLLLILIVQIESATFSYSTCSASQIFNSATLQCTNCTTNSQVDSSIAIPTHCICSPGYQQGLNGQCNTAFAQNGNANDIQIYGVFTEQGLFNNAGSIQDCDTGAYPNSNKTRCIPCGPNMKYSPSQGCYCIDQTYDKTEIGCYPKSYISNLNLVLTNSAYPSTQLSHLITGCYYFKDVLSCSQLLNLCTFSLGSSSPECDFFSTANLTNLLYYNSTSSPFALSLSSLSKGTQLNLKIQRFLPTGQLLDEKDMALSDISRCTLKSNVQAGITIGNNIQVSCQFNFNNLYEQTTGKQYKSYIYQIFIKGNNDQYYDVAVYYQGNSNAYKRFFLEDAHTNPQQLRVVTGVQFIVTLNSDGALVEPALYLNFNTLTIEQGVGITSNQIQTVTLIVSFNYSLTSFWSVAIPFFAVLNVIVLVHTIVRTYISYLNRKSPFIFFFHFIRLWSLWVFYFLFFISGYWFFFLKVTAAYFIFIPSQSNVAFYATFYAIAGVMGLFRIIYMVIDKLDKLNTEVFLINMEEGKFKNSWRQIFIINSLAQFYTYRTVSFFWMLMWLLFFMSGLKWDYHSAQTVNTSLDLDFSFYPYNRILLYFLGCSILWLIGMIFKIIRRLSVIYFPYPFEDFVDYCNVTNISFFFIRKRSPQAYYIHASIPYKVEVGYKDINEAIHRGLQKNRTVLRQISHQDHLCLYLIYMSSRLEAQFNNMLRKIEQLEDEQAKGSTGKLMKKGKLHPRSQFIEMKLKPRLAQISRQKPRQAKSIVASYCGIPPVNMRDPGALSKQQTYLDQHLDLVSQVFPNGNQIEDIHTLLIIFLLWNLLVMSSPIAAFLTFFVDKFIINGYVGYKCRVNLQRMTKVKQGFML